MHLGLKETGPLCPKPHSWEPCRLTKAPNDPQVSALDVLWLQKEEAQMRMPKWGQNLTPTENNKFLAARFAVPLVALSPFPFYTYRNSNFLSPPFVPSHFHNYNDDTVHTVHIVYLTSDFFRTQYIRFTPCSPLLQQDQDSARFHQLSAKPLKSWSLEVLSSAIHFLHSGLSDISIKCKCLHRVVCSCEHLNVHLDITKC
jgi:hypothetical protein